MNKFFHYAVAASREHNYKATNKATEWYLCAIIVRGGKILSIGFNQHHKENSLQNKFKKHRSFCCSVHAEVDCLLNLPRDYDFGGCKLFVIRRHRFDTHTNPSLAMAKPCDMCQAILHHVGIKKAYYTIDNNNFGVMKITDPKEK